jgi:hypothetical protein
LVWISAIESLVVRTQDSVEDRIDSYPRCDGWVYSPEMKRKHTVSRWHAVQISFCGVPTSSIQVRQNDSHCHESGGPSIGLVSAVDAFSPRVQLAWERKRKDYNNSAGHVLPMAIAHAIFSVDGTSWPRWRLSRLHIRSSTAICWERTFAGCGTGSWPCLLELSTARDPSACSGFE